MDSETLERISSLLPATKPMESKLNYHMMKAFLFKDPTPMTSQKVVQT